MLLRGCIDVGHNLSHTNTLMVSCRGISKCTHASVQLLMEPIVCIWFHYDITVSSGMIIHYYEPRLRQTELISLRKVSSHSSQCNWSMPNSDVDARLDGTFIKQPLR